jgi:hypothetical protein
MGQAGAVMVAFIAEVGEHLRLVLKPTEGGGVDDPVPVALVLGPMRVGRDRILASPALPRHRRIWCPIPGPFKIPNTRMTHDI